MYINSKNIAFIYESNNRFNHLYLYYSSTGNKEDLRYVDACFYNPNMNLENMYHGMLFKILYIRGHDVIYTDNIMIGNREITKV